MTFSSESFTTTTQTLFPHSSDLHGSESMDRDSWLLAEAIAVTADDRKAVDISVLQVTEVTYLADYFVLATGFSRTQVKAIADAIEKNLLEQFQRKPIRTEGQAEGSWIVQDYGAVIVHLFLPEEREFYNLEAFWSHAQRIAVPSIQS